MRVVTIGLAAGDPSGVGPELCAKLIDARGAEDGLRILLFAGEESLREGFRIAGLPAPSLPVVERPEQAAPRGVTLVGGHQGAGFTPGAASAEGGAATLLALDGAVSAAKAGQVDAVVYGPLNKQALWLAGHTAIDELHFFRDRLGVNGFCCELNCQGELWTSRVTSHIPFREVADAITIDAVVAAGEAGARAAQVANGRQPRIAVAGLNPHLGEGGAMGMEEIEVILPAIEVLRGRGYDVAGLYPADTVFRRVEPEAIDLVVTMFHDQGQIALKALGFGGTSTVLGGLPLPVVTASQGTAYDIVGQNRADPAGLIAAFDLARRLATGAPAQPPA